MKIRTSPSPATVSDAEQFIDRCNDVIMRLEDLPSRAEDFVDGCRDTLNGMIATVERTQRPTPKMKQAVENIVEGISRWED